MKQQLLSERVLSGSVSRISLTEALGTSAAITELLIESPFNDLANYLHL